MSDKPKIVLELELEEVNSLLTVLGDLPTKTYAWPLMMKIKQMADAQVQQKPAEAGE